MTQTRGLSDELLDQLQNLPMLISVASAESIARAAELVFKTPSAITRSILELERCLGVQLFERKPRGMLLSAYGDAVLVRARRIEDEVRTAAEELTSSTDSRPSSTSAVTKVLFNGRKLQLLIHLANERNISSAAARMNMTQAGASMALSRLEAGLGKEIFQRTAQGMVPTVEGEHVIIHAKRIFAELRHMSSDIEATAGNVAGRVVIGTLPLGRTHVFPTAIAAAIARNPGIHVTTIESPYEQLVGSLRSGDIDIVVSALRPKRLCVGLSTEALFTDSLGVLVRAGHPLAHRRSLKPEKLLDQRWVLPGPNSPGRPMVEAYFKKLGLKPPEAAVETADLAILRQLLNASDMVAVTSPHQLMFEIQSGSLVVLPLDLGETRREIGIIVREGAMLSPPAIAVLEAVREQGRIWRERRAGYHIN
jgi:LysR family transcriptional regulator of gallate degradation